MPAWCWAPTVTEMTRTFRRQPFRLGDHLERLFRSLRYTRMDIGLSLDALTKLSHELLAHNSKLIDDAGDLGLIHFVTAGEYPTYAGCRAGRRGRSRPCASTRSRCRSSCGPPRCKPALTW